MSIGSSKASSPRGAISAGSAGKAARGSWVGSAAGVAARQTGIVESSARHTNQLTKAYARVLITDYRFEMDTLPGLLNPDSLKPSIEVGIGMLDTVGGTSSILQYGHTKAMQMPLELYFSSQFQGRMASAYTDMTQYVYYFSSFCYPTEMGAAPPIMLLIWPNVMDACFVVKNFQAEYTRFASYDMSLQAVKINLQLIEYRVTPRTADYHRMFGFTERDAIITQSPSIGNGLKLKTGQR